MYQIESYQKTAGRERSTPYGANGADNKRTDNLSATLVCYDGGPRKRENGNKNEKGGGGGGGLG